MRRVFWRHRWLLIALLLIPVAAVAPLRLTQPETYAATASIQAQAAAPDADTQVTAIMSRVTAVATSPTVVQVAIKKAGVNRNALDVARHEVAVTSLSSSAIVTVTVTDPSRPVAIRLSRSLANAVVNVLNGLGTQSSLQLASLARQRLQLDTSRARLLAKLASAQASKQLATSAGVQALIAELNAVETQISANVSSVQQVLSVSTINEGAGVISSPDFATSVSRHVAVYCALAGLLGLVVGLLIATIHELSRPTIAEPGAGARELGLVLLGDAQLTKEEPTGLDEDLTTRLELAADRLGARTLVLTGPVPSAQLTRLAAHLNRNLPAIAAAANGDSSGHTGNQRPGITPLSAHVAPTELRSGAAGEKSPAGSFGSMGPHALGAGPALPSLTVAALPDITLRARPSIPALVLVLPRFAPRAALDQAVDLGVATGWPILGVIGLRRRRRGRAAAPTPSLAAAGPWSSAAAAAKPKPAAVAKPKPAAVAKPKPPAAAQQGPPADEPKPPATTDEKATAYEKADQQGAAS
jgi:capsular polysaccharide biosynthesis protein